MICTWPWIYVLWVRDPSWPSIPPSVHSFKSDSPRVSHPISFPSGMNSAGTRMAVSLISKFFLQKYRCDSRESREKVKIIFGEACESRILAKMWSQQEIIYTMSMSMRTSMCHVNINVHGHTSFMPMFLLHIHVHAVCLCGCGHVHYDAAC
jgi:hypothetical protein